MPSWTPSGHRLHSFAGPRKTRQSTFRKTSPRKLARKRLPEMRSVGTLYACLHSLSESRLSKWQSGETAASRVPNPSNEQVEEISASKRVQAGKKHCVTR